MYKFKVYLWHNIYIYMHLYIYITIYSEIAQSSYLYSSLHIVSVFFILFSSSPSLFVVRTRKLSHWSYGEGGTLWNELRSSLLANFKYTFSSGQLLSCVRLFATPWITARQASLSITNSGSLPNSCPLSRWCHPTISSSVIPFSSHLQSFPALGSFQMSQLFASGGQSIGVSASVSVLPMNILDRFPLGLTSWISLQSKGLSRVFSNTTVQKHRFFDIQLS